MNVINSPRLNRKICCCCPNFCPTLCLSSMPTEMQPSYCPSMPRQNTCAGMNMASPCCGGFRNMCPVNQQTPHSMPSCWSCPTCGGLQPFSMHHQHPYNHRVRNSHKNISKQQVVFILTPRSYIFTFMHIKRIDWGRIIL